MPLAMWYARKAGPLPGPSIDPAPSLGNHTWIMLVVFQRILIVGQRYGGRQRMASNQQNRLIEAAVGSLSVAGRRVCSESGARDTTYERHQKCSKELKGDT